MKKPLSATLRTSVCREGQHLHEAGHDSEDLLQRLHELVTFALRTLLKYSATDACPRCASDVSENPK